MLSILGWKSKLKSHTFSSVEMTMSWCSRSEASPQQATHAVLAHADGTSNAGPHGTAGPEDQTQPATAEELASVHTVSPTSHASESVPELSPPSNANQVVSPASPASSMPSSASQMANKEVLWLGKNLFVILYVIMFLCSWNWFSFNGIWFNQTIIWIQIILHNISEDIMVLPYQVLFL